MAEKKTGRPGIAPSAIAALEATRVGVLADGSAPGTLLVHVGGSAPVAARTTLALDEAAIRTAVASRQPAVLVFEDGDPSRPILIGLLQPDPAAALLTRLLHQPAGATQRQKTEARVDGKRVVLEGSEEVVLKCGEASITLKRDGKVILRGAYVETTSKGVNRIRGGSVKIN